VRGVEVCVGVCGDLSDSVADLRGVIFVVFWWGLRVFGGFFWSFTVFLWNIYVHFVVLREF